MDAQKAPSRKGFSLVKLVLFGMVTMVVLFVALFGQMLAPLIRAKFFPNKWFVELADAQQLWRDDRPKSDRLIQQAFVDAREAHAPLSEQMQLRRTYGSFLYSQGEMEEGDRQIQVAIDMCKNPAPNSGEADQLTHAYQDRAWSNHYFYLDNPKLHTSTGQKDQEMSVAVSEKGFGPEHEQTIFKIPSLACIYADAGLQDKADKAIERAVTVADSNPGAHICRPFAYTMLARVRAVEHQYGAALKAFLKATELAGNDEQRERAWSEFCTGLKHGHHEIDDLRQQSETLIVKEKFDELDELGTRLVKTRAATGSGYWQLDYFFGSIVPYYNSDDERVDQRLIELRKWLAAKPQSPFARVCLAEALLYRAWGDRNQSNPELFRALLQEAESLMAAAPPGIVTKFPRAYITRLRLLVGHGWNTEGSDSIARECHKDWPSYRTFDSWAIKFFLNYGSQHEAERYMKTTSDSIGGAKGDAAYAQMAWDHAGDFYRIFNDQSPFDWKRAKAGFKEIFSEYPDDMDARIEFMTLAYQAGDDDAVTTTFDDLH